MYLNKDSSFVCLLIGMFDVSGTSCPSSPTCRKSLWYIIFLAYAYHSLNFPRARFRSRPFVCFSSQEDATNPTARASTKSYNWPCRFAGICALLMATVRWQRCSRGKMAGFFDMVAAEGPTQREIRKFHVLFLKQPTYSTCKFDSPTSTCPLMLANY